MRRASFLLLVMQAAFAAGPAPAEWLVSSFNGNAIYRYNTTNGQFLGTFVPGGSGLQLPHDIIFDADGNIIVSSASNDRLLRYDGYYGFQIDQFVTNRSGGLDYPVGLAYGPDGCLYVASQLSNQVLRFNATNGAFLNVFVSAGSGGLNWPSDIAFGPDSNLYVAGRNSHRVHRYDGLTGAFIDEFVTNGLNQPFGLTFGFDTNLYVGSANPPAAIMKYNGTNGQLISVFATNAALNLPIELEFGPDGNLYVASYNNSQVVRFNGQSGAFIDIFVTNNTVANTPNGCNFMAWRPDPDGVLEAWRSNQFSSAQLSNYLVSGRSRDPDADGFSNGDEYVSDTDPQDSASRFPNATNTSGNEVQAFIISPTSTGRVYDIYWKTNLVSGEAWIGAGLIQTGNGSVLTLTITNVFEANHYRTGVRLP